MNWIFLCLLVSAILTAAFNRTMPELTAATMSSTKSVMDLAVSLIGQMTLWLGLVGILKEAGMLHSLTRALRPVMRRLFPEVPEDHPAMGAMIMNLAANILSLGNAATPFGLKAMQELDSLNRHKGVATNAMILFLAINSAGVAKLPLDAINVRASLGSSNPTAVILPTLLTTVFSTLCVILASKWLEKRAVFSPSRYHSESPLEPQAVTPNGDALTEAERLARAVEGGPAWKYATSGAVVAASFFAFVRALLAVPEGASHTQLVIQTASEWLLPLLILGIVLTGFVKNVKIYEAFLGGAKDGFQTVVRIIPFLVGVLVAVGMFRASGAMEVLLTALSPIGNLIGFPPEAIPMALIRPLSGSGAFGVMSEALKIYGPDSFVGQLISVLNGSTETTFYVLSIYFGAVQVKTLRHAVLACLVADIVGPIGALMTCRFFFALTSS